MVWLGLDLSLRSQTLHAIRYHSGIVIEATSMRLTSMTVMKIQREMKKTHQEISEIRKTVAENVLQILDDSNRILIEKLRINRGVRN